VANYDAIFQGDLGKAIQKVPWRWIILDESHRAKAAQGRCSKWLAALAASNPEARRLALTGTPMPNGMLDMYGQFRFVERSVFGDSYVRFRARFAECNPMFPSQVKRYIRQDEFAKITDPFIWRVATEDVLDLPDETHQRIGVTLDPDTMRFYKELERELTAEIGDGTVTCANALAKTVRLRQATGGYARRDGATVSELISLKSEKRRALEDFLEDFGDRPLVVFYVFTADAAEIRDVCRTTGRKYSEVSGQEKSLAAWKAGQTDVIGVQLRSGAEGIDLTRSAHAVFYSVDWSPGVYEQALRRVRRPGQVSSVCHYYHLVAANTIDEAIYRSLVNKSNVVNGVLAMLSSRKESR
jgi:SNF2 family DNA or RNA helicase